MAVLDTPATMATPRSPIRRVAAWLAGLSFLQWLAVVLLLVLAWLVLPPLFFLFLTSVTEVEGVRSGPLTLKNFATILSGARELQVLGNSLVFALGSASVAVVLGTALAWLAERTNAPFRGVAYLAAFTSLSIPIVVKVLGWILLLGPDAGLLNVWAQALFGLPVLNIFSMAGMIVVEALLWTPVAFLFLGPPLRAMDPALEESAFANGANLFQATLRVTLPLAFPTMAAVFLLSFIKVLESFEVPAMVGMPARVFVLTSRIYLEIRMAVHPSYGVASAFAVALMALVLLAFYPYYRATRHAQQFATITGKGFRPARLDLGRWRILAGLALLLLPLLVLLPLFPLVWASLVPYYSAPTVQALSTVSLQSYASALADDMILRSIRNSLAVSTTAATVTMVLTLLVAWLVIRARVKGAVRLDQLATLPLVIPSIVLGIALARTYLVIPLPVYGTLWILMLAFIAHYLPYGVRYSSAGLLSLHHELEDSAHMSGASWWQAIARIVAPLILPALVAGWIFVFLGSFRELGIPVLLYGPGTEVVATTILDLWEDAQLSEVAAFCIVLSLGLAGLASLVYQLSRRYGQQV